MIRCMHERALHLGAFFLTLTYSEEELPENGSLRPKDLSLFFKALRRRLKEGERLRYFACGEYGDESKRPHYHALLFGPHLLDRVPLPGSGEYPAWRSQAVADAWTRGIHELGTVTVASAAYVAGYVEKKLKQRMMHDDPFFVDQWTGEVVREQEFTRMSLRPAIGRMWLRRFWRSVYPSDVVHLGGREYRPPRYYDKWMDEDHGERTVVLDDGVVCEECPDGCEEHREVMVQVREKRYEESEDLDAYTLHAKECAHKARNDLFNRRLAV